MALRDDPKAEVIALLNKLGGVTFPADTIIVSAPSALTDDASGKNTAVRVTALPSSAYRGDGVYKYDRIDLANMVELFAYPVPISLGTVTTLYPILGQFADLMGVGFTEADVEDAPIVEGGETPIVRLVAKPGSYRFIGAGELRLSGLPNIKAAFVSDTIVWS